MESVIFATCKNCKTSDPKKGPYRKVGFCYYCRFCEDKAIHERAVAVARDGVWKEGSLSRN